MAATIPAMLGQKCSPVHSVRNVGMELEKRANPVPRLTHAPDIGALGSQGGSEQVPFLNEVLAGTEDRLKPAAQHALEQINTRKDQVASQK